MIPNIPKFARSFIELVHGIPAARAKKERAEAIIKEIEAYKLCLKFLRESGFSDKDLKIIIIKKIIEDLKKSILFANKPKGQH